MSAGEIAGVTGGFLLQPPAAPIAGCVASLLRPPHLLVGCRRDRSRERRDSSRERGRQGGGSGGGGGSGREREREPVPQRPRPSGSLPPRAPSNPLIAEAYRLAREKQQQWEKEGRGRGGGAGGGGGGAGAAGAAGSDDDDEPVERPRECVKGKGTPGRA